MPSGDPDTLAGYLAPHRRQFRRRAAVAGDDNFGLGASFHRVTKRDRLDLAWSMSLSAWTPARVRETRLSS